MKDTLETKDIYNKVEKIVTATHLVAGIMPKSEPMHLALRQESLKLMSSSLYNESLPDQQHIGHFVSAVDSCMSLTKIALATGLITDMNAKWLMKGYAIIKDIYQSRAATVVDLEQYDIKDTLMATVKDNQATKPSPVFNILKTSKVQSVIPGPAIMPDRLQGNSVSISTTAATQQPPYRKAQLSSDDRQSQIYALLSDGEPRLLPDISKFFPALTDKTVQRDLQTLIELGKIKKIGERRWSRYILAA